MGSRQTDNSRRRIVTEWNIGGKVRLVLGFFADSSNSLLTPRHSIRNSPSIMSYTVDSRISDMECTYIRVGRVHWSRLDFGQAISDTTYLRNVLRLPPIYPLTLKLVLINPLCILWTFNLVVPSLWARGVALSVAHWALSVPGMHALTLVKTRRAVINDLKMIVTLLSLLTFGISNPSHH